MLSIDVDLAWVRIYRDVGIFLPVWRRIDLTLNLTQVGYCTYSPPTQLSNILMLSALLSCAAGLNPGHSEAGGCENKATRYISRLSSTNQVRNEMDLLAYSY